MVDRDQSAQILTAIFRPCFFINDDSPYDINDDFPESLGDVREEEITLLLPCLLKQILAVIDDENGNGGPLCSCQYR